MEPGPEDVLNKSVNTVKGKDERKAIVFNAAEQVIDNIIDEARNNYSNADANDVKPKPKIPEDKLAELTKRYFVLTQSARIIGMQLEQLENILGPKFMPDIIKTVDRPQE